jgi:predicted dehydrogenase
VRAKIFGAGSIGNHISNALRSLDYDVTLCDLDPAALVRTRNEIYPARYGQWDDAISLCLVDEAPRGGFDLIIVGTPPDNHIRLALDSLAEEPKAILIEKPVCTPALEQVEELLDRAQAQNCMLFVGYDHVVGAAACRFCELIDEDAISDAQTLDVEFREHWGGIFAAHPWLKGASDTYLGFWRRGGGAAGEHSHAFNLWQHFAHQLGKGRVKQVTASLDYVAQDGAEYDRVCFANLMTEKGFMGRVVQDVVTRPTRKWARLQGSEGFIEWICGYQPGKDAVVFGAAGKEPVVETFAKTRPDDFILEVKHVIAVMEGELESPDLSLYRGLDTALVVAAAHLSSQRGSSITIDWNRGYSPAALSL